MGIPGVGYPGELNTSLKQVTWHLHCLSWTKDSSLKKSENCHPKLILPLEIVVGEENYSLALRLGKNDQSAVSSELLRT